MAEWRENQLPTPTERPEHWVMYFDGSLKVERRESYHSGVVVTEVRQHSESGWLDGLLGNKTLVDKTQVEPVGVVRVW
jgi:hypothetical protein